jgi:LruC domain-containing protein
MFYAASIPTGSISTTGVADLGSSTDTDGDGVSDGQDEYPNDNQRAFNNYYPSASGKASVAFEDLWPYKGDYDMNDVVVDFRYKVVTNASNAVKDVQGNYTLRASGGIIGNGFAVEFPALAGNVSSISGGTLEGGQNNAVVKIFNNSRNEQYWWNTVPGQTRSDSVNYQMSFTLSNPVALTSFGMGEYNPFIWGVDNGHNRGFEIHLPGKHSTGLADLNLLHTGDDNTTPSSNIYYLTPDNLPFAVLIPERFDYPVEKQDITGAYLRFASWAQSGGTVNTNWYQNISGNRNASKIY